MEGQKSEPSEPKYQSKPTSRQPITDNKQLGCIFRPLLSAPYLCAYLCAYLRACASV